MGKNTQNNPAVRQDEFRQTISAIAEIINEALRRTESLAEVTASIALVLRENGLIDVDVEDNAEADTVSVDLSTVEPAGEYDGPEA